MYVLNIGMKTASGRPLRPEVVLAALGLACGANAALSRINAEGVPIPLEALDSRESSETTLVVAFDGLPVKIKIYQLAVALEQDCIAVCETHPAGRPNHVWFNGDLIGPNAAKWAPFNPAFFIGWTGQPVQSHYMATGA